MIIARALHPEIEVQTIYILNNPFFFENIFINEILIGHFYPCHIL